MVSNKIKIASSITAIIVLAILIVNIDKLIPSSTSNAIEQPIAKLTEDLTDYAACFSNYGQPPSAVVFVHSNSCPHCRSMMPIIEELEDEGYQFFWAEGSDSKAEEIVSTCFSNLLSGYVPQFICPNPGEEETGEMSKAELKSFADKCVSVS